MATLRKYIPVKQAASILECSSRDIYALIRDNKIEAHKGKNDKWRITSDTVLRFKESPEAQNLKKASHNNTYTKKSLAKIEDAPIKSEVMKLFNFEDDGAKYTSNGLYFISRMIDRLMGPSKLGIILKDFVKHGFEQSKMDDYGLTKERTRQLLCKAIKQFYGRLTTYESLVQENEELNKTNKKLLCELGLLKERISVMNSQDDLVQSTEEITPLLLSINDIGLPKRAVTCLRRANIFTLEQLVLKTKAQLMKMPNFGRKTLKEVDAIVKSYGLEFRKPSSAE